MLDMVVILYKVFSYFTLIVFTAVEMIFYLDTDLKKKNYYYIIALLFPLSYMVAFILKIFFIAIVKILKTKTGKKLISWLIRDVEFKRKMNI